MVSLAPAEPGMSQRVRDHDWSKTPLGPRSSWPAYVSSANAMILDSRFPLWIGWGREMTMVYNDGFAEILQVKHPWALGRPALEIWSEVAADIGPMLHGVLETGKATWSDDQLLMLERAGFPEECYFTWSYSPVRDGDGAIVGVLTVVTETTLRVVGERRLRTLRELGARESDQTRSAHEACAASADALARNAHDLPFALIYLRDEKTGRLRRAGIAGLPQGHPAAPEFLDPSSSASAWPLPSEPLLVDDLAARFDAPLPGAPWNAPPTSALVLPLRDRSGHPDAGILVAGISPRRPLDAEYRSFLELTAGHIGTAVANARAFEDARMRAEALAELDRAKTTFFSNVSHEFRTPLTLMLGPVESLVAEDSGMSPAQREQLLSVQRNGRRLQKLVNALLDFSRIEAGRAQASFEQVRLDALTTDIASTFRAAMEDAGLAFHVACDPVEGEVFVDPEMWEKIVLNLLSNAFKFTFEGGVTLRLRDAGDHVTLEVADTGTGIPASELPNVFKRFHRVHNAKSRTHEGSGIGLALIQDLARLHGGDVHVASEPGHGTTFTVTIPKGSAHLPRSEVAREPAREPGAREVYVEEIQSGRPRQEVITTTHASGETILVVDDNADMRDYLTRILRSSWTVITASNGEEGLRVAREKRPALVITDVMMPVKDGFALLDELRSDRALRETPIVMLSARAGEEAGIEGLQRGADAYVVKPFSAAELVARVASMLTLRRMRDEENALIRDMLDGIPELCTILASDGTITYQNKAARAAFTARHAGVDVLGRRWDTLNLGIEEMRLGTELRRALVDREGSSFEEPTPSGDAWHVYHIHPIRNGAVVYARDITQRKRDDVALQAARAQVAQAEKLSALGQLVSGVAHELRTPLTYLTNNAFLLDRRFNEVVKKDQSAKEARAAVDPYLREMTGAVERISRLVEDLRGFTRIRASTELVTRPLQTIVVDAVELVRATTPRSHAIIAELHPTGPVRANPAAVQQVAINLLQNAIEAMRHGGNVTLRTFGEDGRAILEVADEGDGISESVQARMLEPLVTTKPEGTGLGLSIVRRIVEEHGAELSWRSSEGKGSTFRVAFPVATSA